LRIKLRRSGREADIGFGGSCDLRRSATSGRAHSSAYPREFPAKTDGLGMPPDDSADSTGERLEARYDAEFFAVVSAIHCASSVQSIMLAKLALDEGADYERAFRNCISTNFDGLLRSGFHSARRYG
jgi:hypothetical protein